MGKNSKLDVEPVNPEVGNVKSVFQLVIEKYGKPDYKDAKKFVAKVNPNGFDPEKEKTVIEGLPVIALITDNDQEQFFYTAISIYWHCKDQREKVSKDILAYCETEKINAPDFYKTMNDKVDLIRKWRATAGRLGLIYQYRGREITQYESRFIDGKEYRISKKRMEEIKAMNIPGVEKAKLFKQEAICKEVISIDDEFTDID